MDDFRSRFPKYIDDVDYTTNAPSYYDDLARKNKLIHLLADKIWEYDKQILEYFKRWEDNLKNLDKIVIQIMVKWLEDGVLADILNVEIMSRKPEIYLTKEEPVTDFENSYWYEIK